jgi:demethylmenaquinone methyltransferase/2-methoxy-6-polyprenyl-1,4-benzoquinol methylase
MSADEEKRSRAVREMFSAIAGRYDLLNHILSANVDRRWRRLCVEQVAQKLPRRDAWILDLGCGTADLSLGCSRLGRVVGCDFSLPMLRHASAKVASSAGARRIHLLGADARNLPFRDACFDAVVSAFVVRNLSNLPKGLAEMRRVLKDGGVLGILDFGLPRQPLAGPLYRFYFTRILPRIGNCLSGVRGPYQHLPDSVRAFPPPERLKEVISAAGFGRVEYQLLSLGIAVLFLACAEG